MSFKKFYMVPLLFFLLIQTLSGVQIPLESKIVLNPSRTVTSRVENNKLHITIGKTAKKITYAGLLLHFRKPRDCRDFQNVRFNICSSQKIRVKCSFGEMKKNVYTNWSRQSADAGGKEFLFERNSFIFPPEKEQILSSVKQITIGFGLWQYDTTKESAEIELSGIQITQPSDVFIIPMPTAGVSIDGTYRDWGHEDVLYNWTPPAYIKLDARHRLPSHTKPSKDLSGRYSLMYDDKNIYFLALIADPTPKQGQYGANPWQNDSIELFLANGVKLRNLKQGEKFAEKGIQIIFDYFTEKAFVYKNVAPVPGIKIPVKFKAESIPINDKMIPGYVVEAAIPLTLLPQPCAKGSLLAHAVKINDHGGDYLCSAIGNAHPHRKLLNFGQAYFEFEGKESKTEYKFGKTAIDPYWPEMLSLIHI